MKEKDRGIRLLSAQNEDVQMLYYLGTKCNLRCTYCPLDKDNYQDYSSDESILDDHIANYFDRLDNSNYKTIILSGGEPTLYKEEVLKILQKYQNKFNIKIISNGTNIDTLAIFAQYNCKFIISYDGHINDRGFDSWETCKIVHSWGKLDGINLTISNASYKNLSNTVQEIVDIMPDLISEELLFKNRGGLKLEIARAKKDFYDFDIEKFKNEIDKVYDICSNLNIFNMKSIGCKNFFSYQNDIISDAMTGEITGVGCCDQLKDPDKVLKLYEELCGKCKVDHCYLGGCPIGIDALELSIDHPYCNLNKALDAVVKNKKYYNTFKKNTERLSNIEFILTENCNMKCTHCMQQDIPRHTDVISKNVVDDIFRYIIDDSKNPITVSLFGGEPLLPTTLDIRRYILEKIKKSSTKIRVEITTNALNITNNDINWLIELKESTIGLGIQVSLDSIKEFNDISRIDVSNNGTFDRVFNNLKIISQAVGIEHININSVITEKNINGLSDWLLFINNNILGKFSNHFSFRTDQSKIEILTYSELYLWYKQIKKIVNLYNSNLINPLLIRALFKVNHLMYDQADSNFDKLTCGMCESSLSVRPNGDIIPCHSCGTHPDGFNNFTLCNLTTQKFNKNINQIFNKLGTYCEMYSELKDRSCKSCIFRHECIRCKIEHIHNGSVSTPLPYTCQISSFLGEQYRYFFYDRFKPLSEIERKDLINDITSLKDINDENSRLTLLNLYKIGLERIW